MGDQGQRGFDHGMTADTCADWDAALAQARLGVTPGELHGLVTGFPCSGWAGCAATRIATRLGAVEPAEPLLPVDALTVRSDAIVDWYRGFLGGSGFTGVVAEHEDDPAIRVLLNDLGPIAATHLVRDDDEAGLDDVSEFARAGAAQRHASLVPAGHP